MNTSEDKEGIKKAKEDGREMRDQTRIRKNHILRVYLEKYLQMSKNILTGFARPWLANVGLKRLHSENFWTKNQTKMHRKTKTTPKNTANKKNKIMHKTKSHQKTIPKIAKPPFRSPGDFRYDHFKRHNSSLIGILKEKYHERTGSDNPWQNVGNT